MFLALLQQTNPWITYGLVFIAPILLMLGAVIVTYRQKRALADKLLTQTCQSDKSFKYFVMRAEAKIKDDKGNEETRNYVIPIVQTDINPDSHAGFLQPDGSIFTFKEIVTTALQDSIYKRKGELLGELLTSRITFMDSDEQFEKAKQAFEDVALGLNIQEVTL